MIPPLFSDFSLTPEAPAEVDKGSTLNPTPRVQVIDRPVKSSIFYYDMVASTQITRRHTALADRILSQCSDFVANVQVATFIEILGHDHQADYYVIFHNPKSIAWIVHYAPVSFRGTTQAKHAHEYWVHMSNFPGPHFSTPKGLQSPKHVLGTIAIDALTSGASSPISVILDLFSGEENKHQGYAIAQLSNHIIQSRVMNKYGTPAAGLHELLSINDNPPYADRIAHPHEWRKFRATNGQEWPQAMCLSCVLVITSVILGKRSNRFFRIPAAAALLTVLTSAISAYYLFTESQSLGARFAYASVYFQGRGEILYGVQCIAIIKAGPRVLLTCASVLFAAMAKLIFNRSYVRPGRCSGAWADRIAYTKEWRKYRTTNEQEWQQVLCLSCVLVIASVIGRRSSCLFGIPSHAALFMALASASCTYYLLAESQNLVDHAADALDAPMYPQEREERLPSVQRAAILNTTPQALPAWAFVSRFGGVDEQGWRQKMSLVNDYNTSGTICEGIIGTATPVEDIVRALTRRHCPDLTPLINLTTCDDRPYAIGGFCDVYRGGLNDGTRIAIKVLRICDVSQREGEVGNKKVFKRAARELYHWSKLQHPNVHSLMGLAIFKGYISMISGWMENGDLMSYLRLKPDADRIKLCMDVCAGLCYIHLDGVVHGDLKAANILVSSHGAAVITDFGNTQLRDPTLKFTSTNFGHSVRWTAPELLLEDEAPQVSTEADVYAFGMTVLEVLTGKVPYEGFSEKRVIILVAFQNKFPPRPNIDICDHLWKLLTSCWSPVPSQRPRITSIGDRLEALYPASAKCTHCQNGNEWWANNAAYRLSEFGPLLELLFVAVLLSPFFVYYG